jgi:hypothetical protein
MQHRSGAVRLFMALAVFLLLSSLAGGQEPQKAASAVAQPANTSVTAELDKLVHVKRVKVGDVVTAHLTAPATLPDGTELSKGTKLSGNVTDLKVKADKEGPSKLGLLFTSVSTKDGKEFAIQAAVVSVAPHFHQGEVDPLTAGNPYSSGGRMAGGTGANTLNNTSTEGEAVSRGLGARAPTVNVSEGQMKPGVSYLPDVTMASYSTASPGTILVSTAGSVYVDAGSRLLVLVMPR